MKKSILLISMCTLSMVSKAQVPVNTGSPLYEDRNITVAATGSSDVGMVKDLYNVAGGENIRLAKGDSVMITVFIDANSITPTTGTDQTNSSADTALLYTSTSGYSATAEGGSEVGTLTMYNEFGDTLEQAYTNIGTDVSYDGTVHKTHVQLRQAFRFVEGESTLFVVKNNSDYTVRLRYVNALMRDYSVVTNVQNPVSLFSNEGVKINNPASDFLNIDLAGATASLALFTLEGEKVKSFVVEDKESVDVSYLAPGMYILREGESGEAKVIMIQ